MYLQSRYNRKWEKFYLITTWQKIDSFQDLSFKVHQISTYIFQPKNPKKTAQKLYCHFFVNHVHRVLDVSIEYRYYMNIGFPSKQAHSIRDCLHTPHIAEIIWVKNVRAIVVCGFLKFMFSKKATKIEKIFTVNLTLT